ncbi:toll/interleukin-1 receptor domain-containing protein [Janthinobacterium sp. SUN073]|uniref:toll/interleukin-1 receptor domain-containing protein n=1 Tax=Janthinobacterium sp. SUN073 TaxID=3004102 RepID=UPI0025B26D3E|nr:toll/interleukin-1 receptor domain-containing protein [Janthinobacterium sp. SUN073]MDN2699331.1 toll/interleukin-1 receptor domain-containing protein [Janthinobacterium sp. SUN073]
MDSKPQVFISYSWSSPEHEQWVVGLANDLGDSGVYVHLDKFDLREGHESIAFMERMVNDPNIKKVLLICDKAYAEKTNTRSGGVGTEAQIISPKIYAATDQNKFVAVLKERDSDGKPYLPTYYASRIYIDLSGQEDFAENFERLVRWINDKPLYQRKPIGERPAYLDEDPEISLGTTPLFRRALEAIKGNKLSAGGALTEYFQIVATNFERLRIVRDPSKEWDEQFIDNLLPTISLRNELNQIFEAIAVYDTAGDFGAKTHRFFESLIPYFYIPARNGSYYDTDVDNFKFLGYEFFLHAVAIFIAHERFDLCIRLLNDGYYFERNREFGLDRMVDFTIFNHEIKTLINRDNRMQTRYLSPVGVFMKERLAGTGLSEVKLAQADFVAYLRGEVFSVENDSYVSWWPTMLASASSSHGAFEIFSRAQSKAYFDRIKGMFAVKELDDLKPLLEVHKNTQRAPRFGYRTVSISSLIGIDKLATRD